MKIPILKGKRVTLRPLRMSDASNYVRWFNDKEVVRHMDLQTGLTLKVEKAYLRKLPKDKEHFNYAIITENGIHIGGSGTTLYPKDKRAKFGIVIGEKTEWNKGYGTEALKLIADFVLKKLGYNRFELCVEMSNKGAVRAYKKVGFKLEGVKRQKRWNIITKKFEDEGVMSILKKEWIKK